MTGDPGRQIEADIAPAHDHDAAGDLLLMAEIRHDAVYLARFRNDVHIIALLHLILGPGHEGMAVAHDDADHDPGTARC